MPDRRDEALKVLENAERLYDGDDLAAMYDRIAERVRADLADKNPVILCVMLGGLVPTAEILSRLAFPVELDYLHATRYRGETAGGELVWKVSPETPLDGRHVLVIDDILDEGTTLEAILNAISAQGPASVRTAILLEKDHDRRDSQLQVDYLGARVPDRYVFGAGMDYRGYFRQLPAVYAVGST